MVHLFDQMVDTIPAGARLTGLKQQGDKLTLDGVAQSNATVAEFMRNIEASPWMGSAQLVKTENVHNATNMPYEFELVVALGTPKADEDGATPAEASTSIEPATAMTSGTALATASTAAAAAVDPAPTSAPPHPAKPASTPSPVASVPPATKPAAAAPAPSAPAKATTRGGAGR
jgi:type IV pilus assembly protein PilN